MSTINRVFEDRHLPGFCLACHQSQRGSICSDRAVGCNRCRIDPCSTSILSRLAATWAPAAVAANQF